jgi:hypothetical protein
VLFASTYAYAVPLVVVLNMNSAMHANTEDLIIRNVNVIKPDPPGLCIYA